MESDSVFLGTVIVSAPEFGVALVSTSGGAPKMNELLIAHIPYNDSFTGASVQAHIMEGSAVICMRQKTNNHKAYIIANANDALGELDDALGSRAYYNTNSYKTADSKVFDNVLEQLLGGLSSYFKNQAHSVDIDTLPGDFDITDRRGINGLHVGRLLSQLRGSPIAYIDTAGLENEIRHVAARFEQHTLTTFHVSDPDFIVDDIAVRPSEAFGIKDGPALKENTDDNTLDLVEEDALPLYRLQYMKGSLIDGEECNTLNFPADKTVHTSDTVPEILAKRRTSLMGDMTAASTLGIASIKSPNIRAIHQVGYGGESTISDNGKFDDILEPNNCESVSDQEASSESLSDRIDDAALNKIIDKLLSADYVEKLQDRLHKRGFSIATATSTLGAKNFSESSDVGGECANQQYPLPSAITLTDPVTGKQLQYFASTSFITQEPDGSILLSDGYGSEIRMSRGNIYISPALDLFLRPGRDLSAMTSRHQSFNSQGSCTINSSDAMYIRAVSDLKMVGATGETGTVVLESKATTSSDNTPGGLLIKSKMGAALIGNDIYIGRSADKTANKGSILEPDTSGSIILDACKNGTITEKSAVHVVDSESCTFASVPSSGSTNAAVTIDAGVIGLYAQQVRAPVQMVMKSIDKEEKVNLCRSGKSTAITLSTSKAPAISLGGSMVLGGSLVVNGAGKFNEGLAAKGILSTNATNGVKTGKEADAYFKQVSLGTLDAYTWHGQSAASLVENAAKSVYQDYFVVKNSFAFPVTYGIPETYRMPGMRWQATAEKLGNVGQDNLWEESYVKNADNVNTACYPGIGVWENATISKAEYKTGSLKDSYIKNSGKVQVK